MGTSSDETSHHSEPELVRVRRGSGVKILPEPPAESEEPGDRAQALVSQAGPARYSGKV